jgi:hypothetical protein
MTSRKISAKDASEVVSGKTEGGIDTAKFTDKFTGTFVHRHFTSFSDGNSQAGSRVKELRRIHFTISSASSDPLFLHHKHLQDRRDLSHREAGGGPRAEVLNAGRSHVMGMTGYSGREANRVRPRSITAKISPGKRDRPAGSVQCFF